MSNLSICASSPTSKQCTSKPANASRPAAGASPAKMIDGVAHQGARAVLQPWTFAQQMSAAPLHARCVCTSEQPRKQADLGCVSGSHAGRAASASRSLGARGRRRSCRGGLAGARGQRPDGQLQASAQRLLGPPCPARKLRTPAVEPWRSAQRGRHRWRRPARARGWTWFRFPSGGGR